MSLLMFFQDDDQALVVTDTLATTPLGEPLLLVSKCAIVPHLQMLIAGTGVAELSQRWAARVQSRMLLRDIEMLDIHTPTSLQEIAREIDEEYGPSPATATATVYHLGVSQTRERVVGYVYRSTNGFASEEMFPAFRLKPEPASFDGAPESLDEMIELAQAIRREQDARPADERIYIGGELVLTELSLAGISTRKVFAFGDLEDQWLEMNARLDASA